MSATIKKLMQLIVVFFLMLKAIHVINRKKSLMFPFDKEKNGK
jgi:hypothetical protein